MLARHVFPGAAFSDDDDDEVRSAPTRKRAPAVKKTTTAAAAAGAPTGRAKASSKRRAQPESDVDSGLQPLHICYVVICTRAVQFGRACLVCDITSDAVLEIHTV